MKLNRKHIVYFGVLVALLVSPLSIRAQSDSSFSQNDTTPHRLSGSASPFTAPAGTFSKHGFAGAPYIRYAPETRWVGGLTGIYYFHLGSDTSEKLTRPSDVSGGVMYSENHQYSIGVDYNLYFARDIYLINGGFHYQKIPIDFFGVGNYSPVDRIDNYTPLYRGLEFYATRKFVRTSVGDGLNAGVEAEFRDDQVTSTQDDTGLIARGMVPGTAGGLSNGAGAIVIYDTRDNIYSTISGNFESFDAECYGRTLGSDYTFSRYTLDARKFIPIAKNQVVAAQWYAVVSNGVVPFYEMAELGGPSRLRGYYQGRFARTILVCFRRNIGSQSGGDFPALCLAALVKLATRCRILPLAEFTLRMVLVFGCSSFPRSTSTLGSIMELAAIPMGYTSPSSKRFECPTESSVPRGRSRNECKWFRPWRGTLVAA